VVRLLIDNFSSWQARTSSLCRLFSNLVVVFFSFLCVQVEESQEDKEIREAARYVLLLLFSIFLCGGVSTWLAVDTFDCYPPTLLVAIAVCTPFTVP